jgi:hypothetical protein
MLMEKRKCIINESIKRKYLFIKSVMRMLNASYAKRNVCNAHGGRSEVVNLVKTIYSVLLIFRFY